MAEPKQTSEVEAVSPAPMTQEQITDKSWEFIDITANKVAKLPKSVQDEIRNSGLKLVDSGTEYIHVVDIQQIISSQKQEKSKAASPKRQ